MIEQMLMALSLALMYPFCVVWEAGEMPRRRYLLFSAPKLSGFETFQKWIWCLTAFSLLGFLICFWMQHNLYLAGCGTAAALGLCAFYYASEHWKTATFGLLLMVLLSGYRIWELWPL